MSFKLEMIERCEYCDGECKNYKDCRDILLFIVKAAENIIKQNTGEEVSEVKQDGIGLGTFDLLKEEPKENG